ncbi:putative porin [Marinicella sp. W31]|uniref:putative porin n=1 Tax=Marinicella sp. W31 TaxID=3023713 RepID=UPI003756714C
MKKKILVSSLLMAMGTSAYADNNADEIALLKQQLEILTQKIEKLESKSQEQEARQEETQKVVEKQVKADKKASWASRLSFSGDFRYRYEYIDQRESATRNRNRIRLRLGAKAQVNDDISIGFRIASGGENPTSANQTIGDSFSTKDLRLDRAYVNWNLNDQLTLTGGKMKRPYYRPSEMQMLWDDDINPEGVALQYSDNGLTAVLGGFSVDERRAEDDVLLFGGQVRKAFDIDGSVLTAGLGYYDYQNLQGSLPLFDGNPRGNTLDANGGLANDFNIAEAVFEYETMLAERNLSLFTAYYQNTAADDLDSAFGLGFNYGKVKERGTWFFGYSYFDMEADAVYALFNDSNFAGGRTDSKGHILNSGFGLAKNTELRMRYFLTEQNQSTEERDYTRFQVDFRYKFK